MGTGHEQAIHRKNKLRWFINILNVQFIFQDIIKTFKTKYFYICIRLAKIKGLNKIRVSKGILNLKVYHACIQRCTYKNVHCRSLTILKTGNNPNVLQMATDLINYQKTVIPWIFSYTVPFYFWYSFLVYLVICQNAIHCVLGICRGSG